jgi:hypothetical protein
MNAKKVLSAVAIGGVVLASTLGVGAGAANALTAQPNPGTVQVHPAAIVPAARTGAALQPVDWHGGAHWHGWDHDHWGAWHGDPWWHPWAWHRWGW